MWRLSLHLAHQIFKDDIISHVELGAEQGCRLGRGLNLQSKGTFEHNHIFVILRNQFLAFLFPTPPYCMQETFIRPSTRDDRVSCIQPSVILSDFAKPRILHYSARGRV